MDSLLQRTLLLFIAIHPCSERNVLTILHPHFPKRAHRNNLNIHSSTESMENVSWSHLSHICSHSLAESTEPLTVHLEMSALFLSLQFTWIWQSCLSPLKCHTTSPSSHHDFRLSFCFSTLLFRYKITENMFYEDQFRITSPCLVQVRTV
jgi:hypothetical protein